MAWGHHKLPLLEALETNESFSNAHDSNLFDEPLPEGEAEECEDNSSAGVYDATIERTFESIDNANPPGHIVGTFENDILSNPAGSIDGTFQNNAGSAYKELNLEAESTADSGTEWKDH